MADRLNQLLLMFIRMGVGCFEQQQQLTWKKMNGFYAWSLFLQSLISFNPSVGCE
jgi:hypothetical protein